MIPLPLVLQMSNYSDAHTSILLIRAIYIELIQACQEIWASPPEPDNFVGMCPGVLVTK